MSKGLFIVGTGTDIGKTYVTGLLLKALRDSGQRAAYFKAAMSGNARDADGNLLPGDALWVKTVSGIEQPVREMCPYVYENAYSPHLAAKIEGNPIELHVVKERFVEVSQSYDYVTAEGSGGILCPLRFDDKQILLEDVIRALNLPCLLVADAGLGTINSVVLTAEYMRTRKLPVKGMIFNRFHPESVLEQDNLRMCQHLTGLPVLACVKPGDTTLAIDTQTLTALYESEGLTT